MKKICVLSLLSVLLLSLAACSPSPTAVKVGSNRVDASEYAFYLNYNWLNLGGSANPDPAAIDGDMLQSARDAALDQIATNEIVRIKCDEYDLELSDEQKQELEENKDLLIESLGGKAAYLDYLNESALTDRAYDKFQENSYYYTLLYNYVMENEGQDIYNDESLRQYFSENYITVKYIRLSLVDDMGAELSATDAAAKQVLADAVLTEAQADNADFDALVAKYNDDLAMTSSPDGIVVSRQEAASVTYLAAAFDLEDGEVGGVYKAADGYYIVQRLPVSAGYFDENRDYIQQSAADFTFTQMMDQWKSEISTSTNSVVDEITPSNYMEYVK